MKLSKLRAKARSAFALGKQYRRYADGALMQVGDLVPAGVVTVEVAVIRGRQFTRPQAALDMTELARNKWRKFRRVA